MIKEMRKAAARGFLATTSRTFPDAILYMPPKECPLCSLSSIFIGGRRSTLTRNQFPATHRHKYLRLAVSRAPGEQQGASKAPVGRSSVRFAKRSRSHRSHE